MWLSPAPSTSTSASGKSMSNIFRHIYANSKLVKNKSCSNLVGYRLMATDALILILVTYLTHANSNNQKNPHIFNFPIYIAVTVETIFQTTKYVSECLVKGHVLYFPTHEIIKENSCSFQCFRWVSSKEWYRPLFDVSPAHGCPMINRPGVAGAVL